MGGKKAVGKKKAPVDDVAAALDALSINPNFTPASLARCHAFLLGTHPRLGADSLVYRLSSDALRQICLAVRQPIGAPDTYHFELKEPWRKAVGAMDLWFFVRSAEMPRYVLQQKIGAPSAKTKVMRVLGHASLYSEPGEPWCLDACRTLVGSGADQTPEASVEELLAACFEPPAPEPGLGELAQQHMELVMDSRSILVLSIYDGPKLEFEPARDSHGDERACYGACIAVCEAARAEAHAATEANSIRAFRKKGMWDEKRNRPKKKTTEEGVKSKVVYPYQRPW